jgi:hypothetical protein
MPLAWTAALFGADLSFRTDITDSLISFQGKVQHLAPGSWTATVSTVVRSEILNRWPYTADQAPIGLAIQTSAGQTVISGAVNKVQINRNGPADTMTLEGVDEYAALDTRLMWPEVQNRPPWTTNAYWTYTGLASNAIADAIQHQIGTLALTERRMPGIRVFDPAIGASGTWQFRLNSLADAVSQIASENGLRVQARRQQNAGIDFTIGQPVNRQSLILDSTALGDSTLTLAMADSTTPVAGGSGELTSRLFAISGADVSGVARRESFTNQSNVGSVPDLQRSADAERAADSSSVSFSGQLTNAVSDTYLWQRDYDLGDTLTLRVTPMTQVVTVSGVSVIIDGNGMRVSPLLGSSPRHALAQLLQDVGGLAARLNNLEVT